MRTIYVRAVTHGTHATPTEPATTGYHTTGKHSGHIVYRINEVPDTVSEALAVFTFNQCAVLGHTVKFSHLHKEQAVRGEGVSWEPVKGAEVGAP